MAATWPTLDAAASDTWPTVDDFRGWLRHESVAPASSGVVESSFQAADQQIRDLINPAVLTLKAARAGIETDSTADGYDVAVVEAFCPAYVRQAILIRAAAIYTRRDSANGTISFGEFATRVKSMDPDVEDLLSSVVVPGVG